MTHCVSSFLCVLSLLLVCVLPGLSADCPAGAQSGELELKIWKEVLTPPDSQRYYVPRGCAIADNGGYWRLEVCPGRWIRQLRVDDGVVSEQKVLGVQSRWSLPDDVGQALVQFDGDLATVPDIIRKTTLARASAMPDGASQFAGWRGMKTSYTCERSPEGLVVRAEYRNGTLCESTKRPRFAVLELLCDQHATFPQIRMREHTTCNYRVILHSSQVCELLNIIAGEEDYEYKMQFGFRDDDIRLSL